MANSSINLMKKCSSNNNGCTKIETEIHFAIDEECAIDEKAGNAKFQLDNGYGDINTHTQQNFVQQ